MAKGKQTPRQKMINLMYLVFIAMMAMNIDQEIIRSYHQSVESIHDTRLLTEDKNTDIFEKTLAAKAQTVPDTFEQPYAQYLQLKAKIDNLVRYADDTKLQLQKEGKYNAKVDVSENFNALNDNEAATKFFFQDGEESKPSANSQKLQSLMADVRNYINTNFKGNPQFAKLVDRANKSLATEFPNGGTDKNGKTWLMAKFYHQPLIAAMSHMEIISNDARNIQSDALAMMLQEKVDATIKFNQYEAIVSAPVDVQIGKAAEATVVLASYSNSNKINISGVDRQENGKGFKSLPTNSVGEHTFAGSITVNTSDGKPVTVPYTHTYNVIAGPQAVKEQAGLLLNADKMNVVYRGLENPMSGSILAADNSRLSLSAPGATVRNTGAGRWVVIPQTGNTVTMTLSGTGPNGRAISQQFEYRIKNLPKPEGQIRGQNSPSMPPSSVENQLVQAALPDFDFPVTITVNSFMVRIPGRAAMLIKGNSLKDASGLLRNLKSGDVVSIFDIKATANGLGQTLKTPTPVTINVQ